MDMYIIDEVLFIVIQEKLLLKSVKVNLKQNRP